MHTSHGCCASCASARSGLAVEHHVFCGAQRSRCSTRTTRARSTVQLPTPPPPPPIPTLKLKLEFDSPRRAPAPGSAARGAAPPPPSPRPPPPLALVDAALGLLTLCRTMGAASRLRLTSSRYPRARSLVPPHQTSRLKLSRLMTFRAAHAPCTSSQTTPSTLPPRKTPQRHLRRIVAAALPRTSANSETEDRLRARRQQHRLAGVRGRGRGGLDASSRLSELR
ncbi:hypothetical protein B0H15DRAFT_972697 [Mycena belliarum]|uniref:Uncharacterized protein n=1 Tax=Mycena belliarum TaxID=1033014 RepID=A0AAD6U8G6_9AGAR|nr:hypothetical protein B0H15DRAFT_972697 [Mycena belliae]